MLTVAVVGLSPTTMQYVMYFWFSGWRHICRNWLNGAWLIVRVVKVTHQRAERIRYRRRLYGPCLSKKKSASFRLIGKPQVENFCLANRSLTGHGHCVCWKWLTRRQNRGWSHDAWDCIVFCYRSINLNSNIDLLITHLQAALASL